MKTLVVGATGATGKHLVEQLLLQGHFVKAFVREGSALPESIRNHERLTVISGSVLDISDNELLTLVQDCGAIASCLGHNISFKGLFLPPRKLVRDATRRLCEAAQVHKSAAPLKFVLMNTVAVRNLDLNEKITLKHRIVISILRLLLPPHSDNESAANYLRTIIGQNDPQIEWVAVRPSGLIDEAEVSMYDAHPSPQRDPIFEDGQISRINVGHFMAELIDNQERWDQWKGQMPAIYNRDHDE